MQADNDDVQDDTKTLTIVYQTIVIFALAFFKQSFELFRMTKSNFNFLIIFKTIFIFLTIAMILK